MSSPPPWGTPGPYIPPAAYGQTPGPDGGPPPPPRAPGRLPWLLGGGLVLVVLAVLAAIVLQGVGTPDPGAAGSSPTAAGTPSPAPRTPDPSAPPQEPDTGRYPSSAEVAQRWLDALADGDAGAAFDLSCPQVQAGAVASAGGGDPAQTLAGYFADTVLDGGSFSRALLGDVSYDSASGTDVVTFVLFTEDGPRPVEIFVIMEGTVCDFR